MKQNANAVLISLIRNVDIDQKPKSWECKIPYIFFSFPNWPIFPFEVFAIFPTSSETNSGNYILSLQPSRGQPFILCPPPVPCDHSRTSLSQSDPTVTNWLWLSYSDPQPRLSPHIQWTTKLKARLLLVFLIHRYVRLQLEALGACSVFPGWHRSVHFFLAVTF